MSTYVDATSGAVEHCETMANLHTELSEKYTEISTLCRSKLWHQLTMSIQTFINNPETNLRTTPEGTNSFLALYDKVVLCVDKKLNPLSLASIASSVADSLLRSDGTAAKAVLENLLEKKTRLGVPATLYTESKLNLLLLVLMEQQPPDDIDMPTALQPVKESIKKNAALLQELAVETSSSLVHSAHYECSMKYRKAVGPPEAFYQEAISYLNYTSIETMEDPQSLAVDLSLAALTGDGVFNFGQIVTKPILGVLKGTSYDWLVELIHTMANGNVEAFHTLTSRYAQDIQAQPALVNRAAVVKEKIALLALVNMVFDRPSNERTLTFQEMAERIQTDHVPDVELVVMRALSLKLMEGWLDQVSQEFQVTWVMPRVLTNDQMKEMGSRFAEWAVKVSKTKDYMDDNTPSLFA